MILILLNLPLIIAGVLSAVVSFKLGQIGRRRFILRLGLWIGIFAGLLFAEPIYAFLFSRNLTHTEPLSLFDVIQVTGIIFILFVASQAYSKINLLEKRVQDLHQELSIRLSQDSKKHD